MANKLIEDLDDDALLAVIGGFEASQQHLRESHRRKAQARRGEGNRRPLGATGFGGVDDDLDILDDE